VNSQPSTTKLLFSSHHHLVLITVDFKDIERLGSRKSQPLPLADGHAVDSLMLAEYLPRPVNNLPLSKIFLLGIGLYQALIITETDILALRPIGNRQPQTPRPAAHLVLMQIPQGEKDVGQLLLRKSEEKIGLILFAIGTT
jgi:hypothetical protein